MRQNIGANFRVNGRRYRNAHLSTMLAFHGFWLFRAYYPKENPLDSRETQQLKWEDGFENIVVNQGLNYLLDSALSNGTILTAWYLQLINGASPTIAAADTYASHAGWSENTAYDEAARPTWTDAGSSSQSITNSASPATFTISTNSQTIGGAALGSFATKGDTAQSGAKLYAAGTFASAKALDDNETLDVTATFTAADA